MVGAAVFVDTHAHLQGGEFRQDLTAVFDHAAAAGVGVVILPAVDLASAEAGLALARRFPGCYASVGVHPHEAATFQPPDGERIEALIGEEGVVAVGEIGLDYYRLFSPREVQVAVFEQMLDLAARHRLPVIVHRRAADDDVGDLLAAWSAGVRSAFGARPLGVMHYYSGDQADAERYLDLGFLLSIHTSVTHPKNGALRDLVRRLPIESLVVETDAPYGAPQAHRGKRNEPAYVIEAAKAIAAAQGRSLVEVAAATRANAARLFGLALPVTAALATGAGR